jgi:hypothetical protein
MQPKHRIALAVFATLIVVLGFFWWRWYHPVRPNDKVVLENRARFGLDDASALIETAGDRAFATVHGKKNHEVVEYRIEYLRGDNGWIEVRRENVNVNR